MAIDYEKVNWNTNSYVNPDNMNHMDEGIKQACDKADSLENGKLDKVVVIGNADLNLQKSDGTFYCMGGANSPCGDYGFLTVYSISHGGSVKQIYRPYNKPQTYVRYFGNNSWHEWNAITANYNQKYAWLNASVGAINNGDRLSVSFDDSTYECEKHVNLTSILPNGFTQNNCVILSANSTWSPSWGQSASTGTEMMIMNRGRVGMGVSKVTVTDFYVANVLVMRTDI